MLLSLRVCRARTQCSPETRAPTLRRKVQRTSQRVQHRSLQPLAHQNVTNPRPLFLLNTVLFLAVTSQFNTKITSLSPRSLFIVIKASYGANTILRGHLISLGQSSHCWVSPCSNSAVGDSMDRICYRLPSIRCAHSAHEGRSNGQFGYRLQESTGWLHIKPKQIAVHCTREVTRPTKTS